MTKKPPIIECGICGKVQDDWHVNFGVTWCCNSDWFIKKYKLSEQSLKDDK